MKTRLQLLTLTLFFPLASLAQVNSGSDGHDGAFNPTVSTNINMADHPDGIYHYTSVNIPAGVTVTFIPNANNSPVVWLVQSDCVIQGAIDVSGKDFASSQGGSGGPGGFRGGAAGGVAAPVEAGLGLGGGGSASSATRQWGGPGSYATLGIGNGNCGATGITYGTQFVFPMMGGSGGGGCFGSPVGGTGGGGAILISSDNQVVINGTITAKGGNHVFNYGSGTGGAGSGGAIRIVTRQLTGIGALNASGGSMTADYYAYFNGYYHVSDTYSVGGQGRIRVDALENTFTGSTSGVFTNGFQPIIFLPSNQTAALSLQSVGSMSVPASPSSSLANPAVIIPGQQANPIPIVVHCSNIPLNTPITVTVKPVNGAAVSATANNTAGTAASSTATVNINMPRGGGIIYATTVIGIAGQQASLGTGGKAASYAQTGLTTGGERFTKMEITAALGGKQEVVYITESGKRFSLAAK